MTSEDDFDALIESAYAEPLMITGAIGDEDITAVVPVPPRPSVDLGTAGSLIQARDRMKAVRRQQRGPVWRDRLSILATAGLVVSAVGIGAIIGGLPVPGPSIATALAVLGLILLAGVAAFILVARNEAPAGERRLTRAIEAEQRAGRELAAALGGSPWVLLHDRLLPRSEHRVPFLAVGPAGIALIAVLPPGPYLIMTPGGVKAGDDELGSGWLPARIWEARYLLRQLGTIPTRDLRFTGPIIPIAVEGYPRATKVPAGGWSAEPPYRIDQYQIRRPAVLADYLRYLPTILAPSHVAQLTQLVDQQCPPAPTVDPAPTPDP